MSDSCGYLSVGRSNSGFSLSSSTKTIVSESFYSMFPFNRYRMLANLNVWLIAKSILAFLVAQVILGQIGKKAAKRKAKPTWHESLQIQRRVFHVIAGLIVLYMQRVGEFNDNVVFLSISIMGILILQVTRLYIPFIQQHFIKILSSILRPTETTGFGVPGALYFLVGDLLIYLIFPRNLCSLTILAVTFGDPAAGIFGCLSKSRKLIGSKSLAGALGCGIISGVVLTSFYTSWISSITHTTWQLALFFGVFAVSAAVAETLSVVDDNLTMPFLFASSLKALQLIFSVYDKAHANLVGSLLTS